MLSMTFADYQKDPFTGQYKRVGDLVYSVIQSATDKNILLFDNGGTVKTVKVKEADPGYTYQIRKTFIKAKGGAAGLYEFLKEEIEQCKTGGFYLTVCNKVFEYMS